jgi:hypothetical protein
MKKILFTLFLALATITAKAVTATVYVKAETAPFLYGWFTVNGRETKINGAWPGAQLTEKTKKVNKEGEEVEFWCQTFDFPETSSFNIIFNNGNTAMMQQTGNISDIASDRYFTYNGTTKYTDITEDFGVEIPDVEIQSVALISDLNAWDGLAQVFTEVEPNAKYTYNLSLTDEELEQIEYYYRFKFIVNSSAYLGYDTEGITVVDPNEWIEQDLAQGGGTNFGISFEEETMPHDILFTMEFAGGKDIYQGWTLSVAQGTSGIGAIRTTPNDKNAPRYNLAGQRVGNDFRGLVVRDGRKMLVK